MSPAQKYKFAVMKVTWITFEHSPKSFSAEINMLNYKAEINCEFAEETNVPKP